MLAERIAGQENLAHTCWSDKAEPGAEPNRICIFRQHKRDSHDADSDAAPYAAPQTTFGR